MVLKVLFGCRRKDPRSGADARKSLMHAKTHYMSAWTRGVVDRCAREMCCCWITDPGVCTCKIACVSTFSDRF